MRTLFSWALRPLTPCGFSLTQVQALHFQDGNAGILALVSWLSSKGCIAIIGRGMGRDGRAGGLIEVDRSPGTDVGRCPCEESSNE